MGVGFPGTPTRGFIGALASARAARSAMRMFLRISLRRKRMAGLVSGLIKPNGAICIGPRQWYRRRLHRLTIQDDRVTYQVGMGDDVRTEFMTTSGLSGSIDTNHRSINERTPVFAFSHSVGNVSKYDASQEYHLFPYHLMKVSCSLSAMFKIPLSALLLLPA